MKRSLSSVIMRLWNVLKCISGNVHAPKLCRKSDTLDRRKSNKKSHVRHSLDRGGHLECTVRDHIKTRLTDVRFCARAYVGFLMVCRFFPHNPKIRSLLISPESPVVLHLSPEVSWDCSVDQGTMHRLTNVRYLKH